ncbi:hypothetical protein [Echinimonas agarilytica]|uniref:Type IV pilus biogenesis protein PilP n=1 Tax=Echinimonas agarilytica TaxID=1215918 RepID=A0AA41W3Q7_9GAMM|nr:hypothetical protein [Echinimonas agarilytica]MCM2678240.1 hypothetical protein [Echinimonas agarilytica]
MKQISLIALVLASSVALADTNLTAQFKACSNVSDDSSRLECYDALTEQLSASPEVKPTMAAPTSTAAGVDRSSAIASATKSPVVNSADTLSAEQKFGLENKIVQEQTKAIAEIKSEVVKITKDPYGKLTLELKNQQVWKMRSKGPRFSVGDVAVVERGTLGAFYILKNGTGRKTSVTRLR